MAERGGAIGGCGAEGGPGAADIVVNGEPRPLPAERTLGALFASLALTADWVLVELNGEPVPRDRYATTRLAPGDRLELATPMAGG